MLANFDNKGEWHLGKIAKILQNNNYNIKYDDDIFENDVPAERIRIYINNNNNNNNNGNSKGQWKVGDKIEGCYFCIHHYYYYYYYYYY